MTTTDLTAATITARGFESVVPDNDGAVDADIYADGVLIGAVTLLPDPGNDGRVSIWGPSIDCWADDALRAAFDAATAGMDEADADELVYDVSHEIECAVRKVA